MRELKKEMENRRGEIESLILRNTVLLLMLFMFGCTTNTKETSEGLQSEKLQELPLIERFAFEDLEGKKIDWTETNGKLVFVNFWATWCKPCIKEMPSISEANIKLKEEVIFIVASDEDVEKIKKFESKHHYSFKLLRSKTPVFDLDIQALPTTIIIDKNGKIVFNEIGSRNWASDKNIALIKSFGVE